MAALPAIPIARYGISVDFESSFDNFTDSAFSNVVFTRCTLVLWVDVGRASGCIAYRFVAVFMKINRRLLGPIPYPIDSDSSSSGRDGE